MSVTITFGKYKDQELGEIPTSYLEWLEGEGIKSPRLAEAVKAELEARAKAPAAATPAPTRPNADLDPLVGALDYVKRAERALAQYIAAHEAKR